MGQSLSIITEEDDSSLKNNLVPKEEFWKTLYEPVESTDRFCNVIETSGADIDSNDLIFLCDDSGFILNVNRTVETRLLYSAHNLRDQFIGTIMSDFLSMLHSSYIFPFFKAGNSSQRGLSSAKIRALTSKRPLLIYNALREPIYVEISVETIYTKELTNLQNKLTEEDLEYYFVMHASVNEDQTDPDHLYVCGIRNLRKELPQFRETSSDLVVICIDFVKSTELLVSKGPYNMAFINHRFYEAATNIIAKQFYPYVNFHEIVGDCFVFIVNAEWACRLDRYCASITVNFLNRLHFATKDFVDIRAGVCYGKLVIGFIGKTLRFFGETIHMASRLESAASKGTAMLDSNFRQKLESEVRLLPLPVANAVSKRITCVTNNLKGFGDVECFSLRYLNRDEDLVVTSTGSDDDKSRSASSTKSTPKVKKVSLLKKATSASYDLAWQLELPKEEKIPLDDIGEEALET